MWFSITKPNHHPSLYNSLFLVDMPGKLKDYKMLWALSQSLSRTTLTKRLVTDNKMQK